MAFATLTYSSLDGSTNQFDVTFPYISASHVIVTVNGSATTDFTFLTSARIQLTSTPASGSKIKISRTTSRDARLVDYATGSILTETILDTDSLQAFYMAQEAIDTTEATIVKDSSTAQWTAGNLRITNVADPTSAQDVVSKNYLESTWLSSSDKTNITTVAGKATEIGRLGTTDAVADMALLGTSDIVSDMNTLATADVVQDMNILATSDIVADMNTLATSSNVTNMNTLAGISSNITTLGTSDCVSDMNTLATSDVVADMNTLATSDIVSDMNTLATSSNVTNMDTVATNIANVNTTAGSIANVNTTATNITDVNTFATRYRISSSDPSSSLDEGDLCYNTTSNQMKFYNGSSWAAISSDTDVKTGVSSNDTTAGDLNGKLVAGSNVTFVENNDGGNETLTINAQAGASVGLVLALGG